MRVLVAMIAFACLSACNRNDAAQARARIEHVDASDVRIVPGRDQLPFCLVFSVAKNGVVRQLTMDPKNESVACSFDKPIGDSVFKIPPSEGAAKIYVVFSDKALDATPIAQQIRELSDHDVKVTAMELRAPGTVVIERLDFTPG